MMVPQWTILVAIEDAADTAGIVRQVSFGSTEGQSFMVHQSRPLEARGFIQRTGSKTDKRTQVERLEVVDTDWPRRWSEHEKLKISRRAWRRGNGAAVWRFALIAAASATVVSA
ncbi:hypothetical protein FXB40_19770 [Bradyrhizobium rifense]|uniref:Uncharacterized protein n=1 Tax=Bradyrhizobium rifense TaxID=515499 RepID=A0A5D3KCQ8_9BRAD|nr:hypothetical protein [Bradyrhizobium rifense]TYL94076.1 hypothetical protein FXB40_19770 [Bradyrhizobium rifense]